MNKTILGLFLFFFFLDFSFMGILSERIFGEGLFLLSLMIALLCSRSLSKNIFWILLFSIFWQTIHPFNLSFYFAIWLLIGWGVDLVKTFFLETKLNFFQRNLLLFLVLSVQMVVIFVKQAIIFRGDFFKVIVSLRSFTMESIFLKIVLVVIFYNLLYYYLGKTRGYVLKI